MFILLERIDVLPLIYTSVCVACYALCSIESSDCQGDFKKSLSILTWLELVWLTWNDVYHGSRIRQRPIVFRPPWKAEKTALPVQGFREASLLDWCQRLGVQLLWISYDRFRIIVFPNGKENGAGAENSWHHDWHVLPAFPWVGSTLRGLWGTVWICRTEISQMPLRQGQTGVREMQDPLLSTGNEG